MKRIVVVAVVAMLLSLPVLAARVQLPVRAEPAITLNGTDFIYVQHGWMGSPDENGIYGFEEYGYKAFPPFARDCLGYRLLIDGNEVAPTRVFFFRDGVNWHVKWSFFFRPRSLPAGTYTFTGVYEYLQLDGTWFIYPVSREVTIEY